MRAFLVSRTRIADFVRASFGLFNDLEDPDRPVRVLGDIIRMF